MSGRRRIAHFIVGRCNPQSANGVDRAVAGLSQAQARLGHDVAVFSVTDKPPLPIPGVEILCYARDRRPGGAVDPLRNGLRRFSLPPALVARLRAWDPDIVHMHSVHVPENIALGRVLDRSGIPYGVTIHGGLTAEIRRRHRWRKLALRLLAERKHLESAAFLHGISARDLDGMREYGLEAGVSIVANGFDFADVPAAVDAGRLADQHPVVRGRRVFMFVGRLDAQVKGLDLLCRAFAGARTESAALVLVGPDHRGDVKRLRALCGRLGIANRTVFTGPSFGQEKYDVLAGADVFVHPSRTEGGVPFSVLEAAAMGRPCVVTAAADPSGLLERHGGGVTVRPEAESIAEALGGFLDMDAGELRRMGSRARRMVEQEFDPCSIAAQVVACYGLPSGAHHA